MRLKQVPCAITSGMACVALGVSQSTQDCDLLIGEQGCEALFETISRTQLKSLSSEYRGNLSPPLSANWLSGGWTSRFHWGDCGYLDVFAQAPRDSGHWQSGLDGFYVGLPTLVAMKKTCRERDWPLVTALGLRMLERNDSLGWLHIFEPATLTKLCHQKDCPAELETRRKAILLAKNKDPRLSGALLAEQLYWRELDRIRLNTYQAALKPFVAAMRRLPARANLLEDHQARLAAAAEYLPQRPMRDLGLDSFLSAAKSAVASLVHPDLLEFLPDLSDNFREVCQ